MTDDLIAQLRKYSKRLLPCTHEAADALEAQAREIELLKDCWNAAGARIAELEAALKLYEDALEEAEAIFGGEYADAYGPMSKLAMDARAARAALEKKND